MKTRLMEFRKRAGYRNRDEFAERIGVNRHTYKSWETGTTTMSIEQLVMVADELGCSTDALLGREVRHEWDDPMERALHMTWELLDPERRRRLLSDAQDMAAARGAGALPDADDGMTA